MTARKIPGFELTSFAYGGRAHDVYRAGSGPAVVVVHEIPGIHQGVIDLAQRLIKSGHTLYVPSLFG